MSASDSHTCASFPRTHVHEKKVHYCQAKKVEIYADSSAMLVEADDQLLGSLPATFELLPQMLKIIV